MSQSLEPRNKKKTDKASTGSPRKRKGELSKDSELQEVTSTRQSRYLMSSDEHEHASLGLESRKRTRYSIMCWMSSG